MFYQKCHSNSIITYAHNLENNMVGLPFSRSFAKYATVADRVYRN